MAAGGTAAARQPYSSLEQPVGCAPAALSRLRVLPHVGGFFGLRWAGSGKEAWSVPPKHGSRRNGCDSQVSGGRYGQVGTVLPSQENL